MAEDRVDPTVVEKCVGLVLWADNFAAIEEDPTLAGRLNAHPPETIEDERVARALVTCIRLGKKLKSPNLTEETRVQTQAQLDIAVGNAMSAVGFRTAQTVLERLGLDF